MLCKLLETLQYIINIQIHQNKLILQSWKLFLPWPRSVGSAMTIRHPFGLLLFLFRDKRWHKAKTNYHMANIPQTPNILKDSGPPIKWLVGGQLQVPQPPYPFPPIGGAKVFFGGVMTDWPFWPHRVKYFWGALDLKYNFSYSWGVPWPPNPLAP